jgi:hypothetical protein
MRRALLLLAPAVLALAPLEAQTLLPADAPVHGAPNGPAIGLLKRGATVRTGSTAGGWTAVVIEGWLVSTRVSARRDTLDRTIVGTGSAPLRVADGMGQPLVGELEPGTVLKRLADRNGWTQVRRTGWVRTAALQRSTVRTPPSPRRDSSSTQARTPAPAPTQDAGDQQTMRATSMRASPGGDERASIRPGSQVQVVAHDGGWARVRIEGWVPERDLMITDSSAAAQLSAADLRADPVANRGKIVRWDVQVIAVQRADPLRRALAPDEPYLLARGPGDEGAVLYVALPKTLVDQIRALPQLSNITITARVRDGRSAPVGAPLLDLISFTRIP